MCAFTRDAPLNDKESGNTVFTTQSTRSLQLSLLRAPPVDEKLDAIHAAVAKVLNEKVLDQDVVLADGAASDRGHEVAIAEQPCKERVCLVYWYSFSSHYTKCVK